MKVVLSFVPLILAGIAYSRGVSAEIQSAFGRDGIKLFRGLLLALSLVTAAILLQVLWLRHLALPWNIAVLLTTLLVMEYGFPARKGIVERSPFFVAVGIGLFVAIMCGLALLISVFFQDTTPAKDATLDQPLHQMRAV